MSYQNKIYFCTAFVCEGRQRPADKQNKKTKNKMKKYLLIYSFLNFDSVCLIFDTKREALKKFFELNIESGKVTLQSKILSYNQKYYENF